MDWVLGVQCRAAERVRGGGGAEGGMSARSLVAGRCE